jgi:N-acylneuraminate cytidylyltransferase
MSAGARALAIVIGRAGSRGLLGKNTRPLAGRPLVDHTLDDALEAKSVGRVVVSTDCPRISEAAAHRGVRVIRRPAELAGDTATVDDAVRHALEVLSACDPPSGSAPALERELVILYANVPLRPPDLIDRAVEHLRATGADSVQSYAPVGKCHPSWMVRLEDGDRVRPNVEGHVYRRQDLPPLFLPDGGVIALRRDAVSASAGGPPGSFLGRDRRGIRTGPGAVIDVDDALDLLVAEAALRAAEVCVR